MRRAGCAVTARPARHSTTIHHLPLTIHLFCWPLKLIRGQRAAGAHTAASLLHALALLSRVSVKKFRASALLRVALAPLLGQLAPGDREVARRALHAVGAGFEVAGALPCPEGRAGGDW